jgi:predicted lipoprotein with Yx(FWY)xxD motif
MNRPWHWGAIALIGLGLAAPAAAAFDPNLPYPQQVAVSNDGEKGYIFRRFPGNGRLYTYDLDTKTRSACNKDCEGRRRPVYAPFNAKELGDWTIIKRHDGTGQWAYKGRPVYTLFHDTPEGQGEAGPWRLLPYEK